MSREDRKRTAALVRLTLLAVLLAVPILVKEPDQTLYWRAFFNAGHAALFGFAALLVASLLKLIPGVAGEVQRFVQAIVVTLVLAAASELLQLLEPTRDASAADFLRDAAGATAFLLLRVAVAAPGVKVRSRPAPGVRVASGLLAVSLLLVVAVPFLLVVDTYVERDRSFPTLFRLDGSRRERPFVSTGDAELVPKSMAPAGLAPTSGPLALLSLKAGVYPGLVLDEPYPDWRGFSRLVFTAYSDADTPLALTIRIHDAWHDQRYEDRFNKTIVITRGEHQIAIPLDEIRRAPQGREMDSRQVRGIVIFAYRLERPAHVYLGFFRLE
jgi:VanZ family protein